MAGNYNFTKGATLGRNINLKRHDGSTVEQCAAECDGEPRCEGFNFSASRNNSCETYAGLNPSGNRPNSDWDAYVKKNRGPLPAGKYTGAPTKVAGCCGSIPSATFALEQGARQPQVPNTNGRGSCGGFNGYGGWNGWDHGFGQGMPANGCPEKFDTSMCPIKLGKPVGGSYGSSTGIPGSIDNFDLFSICKYSELKWDKLVRADGLFDDETGKQMLKPDSWINAKNDYCSDNNNIDKLACRNWLNSTGAGAMSYNAVKLGICSGLNNGDWSKDTTCVNAINQIYKTGSESDKNNASQMVNILCGTNPGSKACACYNAVNNTVDQCLAKPNLPGCQSIIDKVGKYKSLGASFLTANLKPFCACDECTQAKTGSAGLFISQPAADQPGLCSDKINACFQQVTVGSMSGGNLNAGCTINDINNAAGAPPVPAATPGAKVPAATPGATVPAATPGTSIDTKSSSNSTYIVGGGSFVCSCIIVVMILLFFMMKKKTG
jgi:hypothetical protein